MSLQRLRPFIAQCRERFGLRYPLAHLRPFTDRRRLLLEAQTEAGLTGELRVIYELASGQLELRWRDVTFLERVDRGGDATADIALALMPRRSEWIPQVAAAGMAIISRDRAISRRRAEKDAILAADAQMFDDGAEVTGSSSAHPLVPTHCCSGSAQGRRTPLAARLAS